MSVVTFDYPTWTARYPEFQPSVSKAVAQLYFDEATLYVANDACAIVPYEPENGITTRATILNMLTSHIAAMNAVVNGIAPSPLVGRISDASEGSVSVSAAMGGVPGTAAWFMQSKYGSAAYQAMAPYRTARYMAPRQRFHGARW